MNTWAAKLSCLLTVPVLRAVCVPVMTPTCRRLPGGSSPSASALLESGKPPPTSIWPSGVSQMSVQGEVFTPSSASEALFSTYCQCPLVVTWTPCTGASENMYGNVQLCIPALGHNIQLWHLFFGGGRWRLRLAESAVNSAEKSLLQWIRGMVHLLWDPLHQQHSQEFQKKLWKLQTWRVQENSRPDFLLISVFKDRSFSASWTLKQELYPLKMS